MNINRRIPFLKKLIRDNSTKILIYSSFKVAGDDFDPYRAEYTEYNSNPLTLRGYVRELSPEALVWKTYGLKEMGAKEIICDEKYASWFRNANKIEIDSDTYEVYKEGVGNRAIIQKRPYKMIRVVLQKV
jgi:hypothetical protein